MLGQSAWKQRLHFVGWGETGEWDRGCCFVFFPLKRSGKSSNLLVGKMEENHSLIHLKLSHVISGPPSAFTAHTLRRCPCFSLTSLMTPGVWETSLPSWKWAKSHSLCCMGEQGGHHCSQGHNLSTHPLQTLQPAQGNAGDGLQLTQTGC